LSTTLLSQDLVNEIVLVVTAPPSAVMVYVAIHVPNEAGNEAVLQPALESGDPHDGYVIPVPVTSVD